MLVLPLGLLDRLRATSRLGVVIALLLIPGLVATVAYTYSEGGQISFSSSERDGVRVLRPTLAAMATLVGSGTLDLTAVNTAAEAESQLGLRKAVSAVSAASSGADLTTAAGRVASAESLSALVTEVGNASNLILDPDLDSFYVMDAVVVQMPRILQTAAEAAASKGIAARAVIAGELSTASDALRADVKTAVSNTSATGLSGRLAGLVGLADATSALATSLTKSLGAAGADVSAVAKAAAMASGSAQSALDGLLKTRIGAREFARNRVLAITVVGFVLAFWLAFAVWWRSRTDVAQVVAAVRAIAARDTSTHRLPSGRDEFGDIGRALTLAGHHLEEQDAALQEAQRQQEQQNRDNHAQQRRAEKQARQLAQQIISESVTALTTELAEVAAEVDAVRTGAGTIHERVGNADEALRAVLGQAGQADAVTSALAERLQRVAGMTKVIASVADQTKMLALNATIEAARAGDSGQGFAVVANEVKELAATTAHSTEEITSTIQALEREADAVSATITAMTSGIDGVDQATGALLGVATEQQGSVASMEQRISSAMERVRGMSDLTNLMERRTDERIPVTGTAWFQFEGARHELRMRDLSEGGMRGELLADASLRPGRGGRLELPVPGLPLLDVELLRSGTGAGSEAVFRFTALPPSAEQELRAFLDAQM